MKTLNKTALTEKINKSHLFALRYILCAFAVFTVAFILLKFPSYSADGVKKGTDICFNSLIPGLYPFMILTNIFISSKLAETRIPIFEGICRAVFRLPGCCASVIVFSLVGGLPIGAKMSAELYGRGLISREQWGRMMCFCVNPGPAFVIYVVGLSALGSEKTGAVIYISLVFASLLTGFLSRFFGSDTETYITVPVAEKETENGSLAERAVIKSSKSLLAICSWVVAFSCLCEVIVNLDLSEGMSSFLLCITEMTRGSLVAAENYPVPIVAAVIGFSGICGHFQLMGEIGKAGLKYKHFLISRIINSGLSALICGMLLKLFPVAQETFAVGVKPGTKETSGSFFLSLLMIIMAVLFVLGDDYRISRKKV